MKKRSITYKTVKAIIIIMSIPIILLWLLMIMLYIPPVQRFAVDTICKEVKKSSGFDIEIGTLHLAFPLKLDITDIKLSRGDTIYADGSHVNLNISPAPLFSGEVEVNYLSLERIRLNTMDLIPGMSIDGEIGFFRTVARNVDLDKEFVHLRQLHLHSTTLNIELNDTTSSTDNEDEESQANWIVKLHKGNIENCRINVHMPFDTLRAETGIGKIRLNDGTIDLKQEFYSISSLKLNNCNLSYNHGAQTVEEAPMDHITLNNINLDTRNLSYTPDSSRIEIHDFTLIQPGGIRITDTRALLTADTARLNLQELSVKSKNGSRIECSTSLPWKALTPGNTDKLQAKLTLALDKRDLAALLTQEEYSSLSLLSDSMLIARVAANGNVSQIAIDNIEIEIPSIATINAQGHAQNITDTKKLEALLHIDSNTTNIKEIIQHYLPNDNGAEGQTTATADQNRFTLAGTAQYKAGEASADITMAGASGIMFAKAKYDTNNEKYRADINADGLNLSTILPNIPLYDIKFALMADGEGMEIFDSLTRYDISLVLDSIHYGDYKLNNIQIKARQENGLSNIEINSDDHNLQMKARARTNLSETCIANSTSLSIGKADLTGLGISMSDVIFSTNLNIEASTDMNESHALRLICNDTKIITEKKTYTPAAVNLDMSTSPSHSFIEAKNGDLKITGAMDCGYNHLFKSVDEIAQMYARTRYSETMSYYLHDYEKAMPEMSFEMELGKTNMLANILAMNGLSAESAHFTMKLDTIKGLNINSGIYGLTSKEIKLDTIRMFTRQEGNKIRYLAGVRSTSVDPNNHKQSFSASLYGNMCMDSLSANIMFRDRKEGTGLKLGAMAIMKPEGLDIALSPNAILFKKAFHFNSDNYIKIGKGMSIDADVTLTNSNNAGMHLFTTPDPTAKYNANLELFNVNLKELTAMTPFAPDIAGMLNMDLYFRQDSTSMLISSDLRADSLIYEDTYIGNEAIEFVYLPKSEENHYLDLIIRHEDEEVAHMSGNYINDEKEPGLHGDIVLSKFPLSISNAFIKESGMTLSGYINSEMSATGKLSSLNTDGFMQFDSVYIDAPLFGTKLNMADELVNIKDNKIIFDNFNIYTAGNNPFKINGNIDLSQLSNPGINLRMRANDYELINAPRRRGSMLYGKLSLNFMSFISGTLQNMKIYGNATLLNKTNITYVMLDSPIESDKELDGLVEFVNFKDTTYIAEQNEEIDLGNTNIDITLNIEDGARINADFDENRSSYITLSGGGNLHMTYTDEAGMGLTGTYSMNGGQLKYALPVIPLKTFNIAEGSKVTWNGDIMNPDIDIIAVERVTTSVTLDDNSIQPVAFDVGVKLSNTLSDIGLEFTLSAPENAMVQDQLNMLDESTLNKYAVTMLITGTYIGGSNAMTASGAISSFLDAKINELAGNAMKSVSLNVGINDAQNAETGGTYKNYSFSFSKRFWNDRLTIVIGGEVNSGDSPEGSDSFINNISLEWKISKESNRYIRLFYDKNYESLLEGEITEAGIGYVYKRKLNNLNELMIFRKKDKKSGVARPTKATRGVNKENGNKK